MTVALGLAGLWLILAGVFAGIGLLVLGRHADPEDGWATAHAAFWCGVPVVTVSLLAWHLVLPVNVIAAAVVAAFAAAGIVIHRRVFVACLRGLPAWPAICAVAAAWVWVANHALDSAAIDDYLYEFQAVRWDHDYAIVPGLANLHGRLGFNESHHLLDAMLSVGPLAGRVNHVLNGLFVVVVLTSMLWGLADLWRRGLHAPRASLVRALLAGPAAGLAMYSYYGSTISTLKADVIVTACVLEISCLVVALAEMDWDSSRGRRTFLAVTAAAAFVATVKLSAVVFAVIVLAGVCGPVIVERVRGRLRFDRVTVTALAVVLVAATLVPTRGVVLSGYPAYPLTIFGSGADWAVPARQADTERTVITSWARLRPTYDVSALDRWSWLPYWGRDVLRSEEFSIVLPLALTLMCLAGALVAPGTGRRRSPGGAAMTLSRAYRTTALACAAGLTAWWFAAPAGRFAVGLFWSLAAIVLAWSVDRGAWRRHRSPLVAIGVTGLAIIAISTAITGLSPGIVGLTLLLIGATAWLTGFALATTGRGLRLAVLCVLLATVDGGARITSFVVHHRVEDAVAVLWLTPARYMRQEGPSPIEARTTLSGLTVYVTGSTAYDTPLPNTRYFNPYLELRRAGDLASGFRSRVPPEVAGYGYSPTGARPAAKAASR